MAEEVLHATVAQLLHRLVKLPAKWTCIPTGQLNLPPQYAAKLTRAGVQSGWPDFMVLHQFVYGIELKRPGAPLTKSMVYRTAKGALRERRGQVEVFPELESAGMAIGICHSVDEVLTQLKAWGIPLHAHA